MIDRESIYEILAKPVRMFGLPKQKDKIRALQCLKGRAVMGDLAFVCPLIFDTNAELAAAAEDVMQEILQGQAEINDLTCVYPLVFDKNTELATAAAEAVQKLMGKVSGSKLIGLYDRVKFLNIEIDCLERLLKYPDFLSVPLLGIATLNKNGYVREKALKLLAVISEKDALPYVLLRVCDWVEPIRRIAHYLLRTMLIPSNASAFITNFYFIERMKKIKRTDLYEVWYEIQHFLMKETVVDEVKFFLNDKNVKRRLFCYSILQERLLTDQDVVNFALKDTSSEVKLWLIKATEELGSLQKEEIIQTLLHDKSARVKVAVLRRFPEKMCQDYKEQLLAMTCDLRVSLREEARYLAQKQNLIVDIPSYYRRQIQSHPSAGALLGLGETGSRGDYALIGRFLSSENIAIKCAAMTAMSYLNKEASLDFILNCLEQHEPRIRKAAKRLLRNERKQAVLVKMKKLLVQEDIEMKLYALQVICLFGGWQALDSLLWVISRETGSSLERALALLDRWLMKSAVYYIKIDQSIEKTIQCHLDKIKKEYRLSEEIQREIQFVIKRRR